MPLVGVAADSAALSQNKRRFRGNPIASSALRMMPSVRQTRRFGAGRHSEWPYLEQGFSKMAVILVVEDDVFIREMAESMIQDLGHQVLSACDVPEALVHLKSPQHIDALFTDVNLKTEMFGGCDLARLAALLRPGLPVLYTTATRDPDGMQARFAAGVLFLSKPYTEQQLGLSVQNLFAA